MASNEFPAFSLQAQSPRYARYEARIRAIRKVLDGIRRHRVALAITLAAVMALVLCFLGTIGHFTGEARCADFTYGDLPGCSLKAFLSDVEYQYAPAAGEPVWSGEAPAVPGRYRIRAVSKNGFGVSRYSAEMTAVLLPRELTVCIADAAYVYGDFSEGLVRESTSADGLVPGDSLAAVEYTVEGTQAEGYRAAVSKVRIVNGAGKDVTAGYAVTTRDGAFTRKRRPITVRADSFQKVYDGLTWDGARAELTEGSLALRDELKLSFPACPTEAGTHALVPECRVLDGNGNDVTGCYTVTVHPGTLTVFPCPITVRTGSGEKVYDGRPLTNSEWSVVSGEPAPGHSLSGSVTGGQTHAGESPNTISLTVRDASGTDVSANYQFTVQPGILKVTPIVLRFQTDGKEKVYDGKPLRADGCRLLAGSVLGEHTLHFHTDAQPVDAGVYQNTLRVTVRDGSGADVTSSGYRIEVDCGTLTIRRCPITVASESNRKYYDGMPLTCEICSITKGGVPDDGVGEHIGVANFTGSQTAVGSSPNTFTVVLCNGANEDTTRNYEITYVFGTLTVLENPDFPGIGDGPDNPGENGDPGVAELPDGGTQIGFPDASRKPETYAYVTGIDLPGSTTLYFRAASYGDYTKDGWTEPKPYLSEWVEPQLFVGRTLASSGSAKSCVHISRAKGCPLIVPYFAADQGTDWGGGNDCYCWGDAVDYELLFFQASYRELQGRYVEWFDTEQEMEYRSFVYDRYLQIPASTKAALLAWAEEKGISPSSPTLAEDIQAAVRNAARYNLSGAEYPEGVDVAVYFLTQAKEGVCQHFATAATLLYRAFGIPARYTTGFVGTVEPWRVTQLNGQNAHAWVEIYQSGLGWIPMEVTGDGAPALQPEDGKTKLTLQACSVVKYYDGKDFQFYNVEQYATLEGSLKEGHRLAVSFWSQKDACVPGIYQNRITGCAVYDTQGRDVSDEYNINTIDGSLQILPRKITIAFGSASKQYDAKPLTCGEYWIAEGSLAPGDRLVLTMDASLTEPGRILNTASGCEIYRGDLPFSYTFCYEITFLEGYLEVTLTEDTDIP